MNTESPRREKTLLLAIVLAGYAMIVIDNSIVITGLPSIRDSLGFSAAGLSWVQNSYALAFGGFMLLGARAGDLLGRRLVFMIGLGIFTAASLAIGLATTPAWLIGSRAIQGAGAAILAPSTLALLTTAFAEGPERSRALSWYGAVGGITASVGLVAGGSVADLVSWRAGFFVNVPLGLLLMWGAARHIDETPRRAGHFDAPGAVLSTLGMVALIYGLVHAAQTSWLDPGTAVPLIMALLLLPLFIWTERVVKEPILPLRLFNSRERAGALAARLLFVGSAMGFFFYTTQYLQGVLGMRPLWAGIAFFPSMLVNFLGALTAPRIAQRFGQGTVLSGALLLSIIGMAWLGLLSADTPFVTGVALPMLLVGAGMGAALASLTISGVRGVAPEDAGSASGLIGVAHQLGGALGLAVMVVVYASATAPAAATSMAETVHRIAAALGAGAVLLSIALLTVLVCIVRRQPMVKPVPL